MSRNPTGEELREGAIPTLEQVMQSYPTVTNPVQYSGPLILADASSVTDWTKWQVEGCLRRMGSAIEMYLGGVWIPFAGQLSYRGSWDADANDPELASGVGTKGYYYVVSVEGSTDLDGITDWKVGDWAIFNGDAWQKIDNTDKVASVFTRTGAVAAAAGDYDASQIDNDSSVTGTHVSDALNTLDSDVGTALSHASGNGADHANVALGDSHRTGNGSDHADVASNTVHRGSSGLDHSHLKNNVVDVVLAVVGGTGGSADGTLTSNLKDVGGAALLKTGVIKIICSDAQYAGANDANANVTFSAAVNGSILASGNGWAVVKHDADGLFSCTITNANDETVWFSAVPCDGGVDAVSNGVLVRGCVADDATWSA